VILVRLFVCVGTRIPSAPMSKYRLASDTWFTRGLSWVQGDRNYCLPVQRNHVWCSSSCTGKQNGGSLEPFFVDVLEQKYCEQEGIQYMGYSTLGSQWLMRGFSTNPVTVDSWKKDRFGVVELRISIKGLVITLVVPAFECSVAI
jgi:hypothetical protein